MTAHDEAPEGVRRDGRDTRWADHRRARRRELVEAALRAIRAHGAGVGMDEVAAAAGTSRTVVYRHLGDRLGLYLAVCDRVDELLLQDLTRALRSAPTGADEVVADPRVPLVAMIDSYLSLVERDPEVYRFVTHRPVVDLPEGRDPVAGLSDVVAAALAEHLVRLLRERGRPEAPASTWSHALVGFVRESADRWLTSPRRRPRQEVVAELADLAAFGLHGVLAGPPTPPVPEADRPADAPANHAGTSTTEQCRSAR